jgi:hypothetical protein
MTVISIDAGKRKEFQNAGQKLGTTVMNFEESRQKFNERIFKMKQQQTGTYGGSVPQQMRPPHGGSAKPQQFDEQDSTRKTGQQKLPPITVTKPKKRLIPAGEYRAVCTGVRYGWHGLYPRWDAVIEFTWDGVPPGLPISKHQSLGTDRARPELPGDNWLGKLALKLGTTDLDELLVGRWFIVNVETIKHRKRTHREVEEGIEIPDRPREEWYSTVRSVRLAEPEEF